MLARVLLLAACAAPFQAQPVDDFAARTRAYLQIHNNAAKDLPALKPSSDAAAITGRQKELGNRIRMQRADAVQGNIFAPPIAAQFHQWIMMALEGEKGARVRTSLMRAEPVAIALKVNDSYPSSVAAQSMPATLLTYLPHLPKELEYRIVGRSLVLLDIDANLIVDFLPNAISSK